MVELLRAVGRDGVPYLFRDARGDFLKFLPYRLGDRGGFGLWRRCLELVLPEPLEEHGRGFEFVARCLGSLSDDRFVGTLAGAF